MTDPALDPGPGPYTDGPTHTYRGVPHVIYGGGLSGRLSPWCGPIAALPEGAYGPDIPRADESDPAFARLWRAWRTWRCIADAPQTPHDRPHDREDCPRCASGYGADRARAERRAEDEYNLARRLHAAARDPRRPAEGSVFYVSAHPGLTGSVADARLIAGPYGTHEEALRAVAAARHRVHRDYPATWPPAFGTAWQSPGPDGALDPAVKPLYAPNEL